MLIRPRFTEYYSIYVPQSELDFATPFLNEDIPLYVDPFLLWKSPSLQDKALHGVLISAFNNLGTLLKAGEYKKALEQIIIASECDEVGLGNSAYRTGKRIGEKLANEILLLFEQIPYYHNHGFRHFEEIQLLIHGISKDRISDIACSFLKSFLIDYTYQECTELRIEMHDVMVENVFDHGKNEFESVKTSLPVHPERGTPLLLVPKRWLRHVPWINYESYFKDYCPQDDIAHIAEELTHAKVLTYNRDNYDLIDDFIKERERTFEDCRNDPLFTQIPIISARRKLAMIKKLPTGKDDSADKKYEDNIAELFASLFYPQLDFAQVQVRTDSGVSIRDLIFYNSRSHEFLREIMDDYGSRQITMEMKNVQKIDRTHIDQLNRYLHDELGKFGVLITRTELRNAERRRVIDPMVWTA